MKLNGLEVVKTLTYMDRMHSPHYDDKLDALMLPVVINDGIFREAFYFKIPGEEIRKCLEYKEVKNED